MSHISINSQPARPTGASILGAPDQGSSKMTPNNRKSLEFRADSSSHRAAAANANANAAENNTTASPTSAEAGNTRPRQASTTTTTRQTHYGATNKARGSKALRYVDFPQTTATSARPPMPSRRSPPHPRVSSRAGGKTEENEGTPAVTTPSGNRSRRHPRGAEGQKKEATTVNFQTLKRHNA